MLKLSKSLRFNSTAFFNVIGEGKIMAPTIPVRFNIFYLRMN